SDGEATRRFHAYKDGATGNNMKYPCVVMLPSIMHPVDKLSDNIHLEFTWELWFLYATKKQDTESMEQAEAKAFELAMDFKSRMIKEYKEWKDPADKPFMYLDLNTFEFQTVGPMGADNAYGISLSGKFSNSVMKRLKYDATKWTT
ncbi:MAG: hypothetical protein ACEQSL_01755, partial [Sediminibacterium sp.]